MLKSRRKRELFFVICLSLASNIFLSPWIAHWEYSGSLVYAGVTRDRESGEAVAEGVWSKYGENWYYLDGSGKRLSGWIYDDNRWYYLDALGVMQVGWTRWNDNWYYMNPDGAMATGWTRDLGGGWYYLKQSGEMLEDELTPDGYWVGKDGSWDGTPPKVSPWNMPPSESLGRVTGVLPSYEGAVTSKSLSGSTKSPKPKRESEEYTGSAMDGGPPDSKPQMEGDATADSACPEEDAGAVFGEGQAQDQAGESEVPSRQETEVEDSAEDNQASPSDASPEVSRDMNEQLQQLVKYREQGIFLESDDQQAVADYLDPIISHRGRSATLIGQDFFPHSQKLDQRQYTSVQSFVTSRDILKLGGHVYHIIIYQITYTHEHQLNTEVIKPSCVLDGARIDCCADGDYREEVALPALGHEDSDGDFLCDRCQSVLPVFGPGAKQVVKTGLDAPFDTMIFTCVDDDYKGGFLFVSDKVIPYGQSASYGQDNSYTWSPLRQWLNFTFADGLSVADSILPVKLPENTDGIGDRVFCLSRAEIKKSDYRPYTMGAWKGEEGSRFYWTRTADEDYDGYAYLVQADGHIASDTVGNRQAGVRPAYVLKKPDAEEPLWAICVQGDVQQRKIDGKEYTFRCIDEDYTDGGGNRVGALFVCDSILSSKDGEGDMVFDEVSNRWCDSKIKRWLARAISNSTGIGDVETTVSNAYLGWSEYYDSGLAINSFSKDELDGSIQERTYDKLFCLSLEEAVRYRGDLWKLDGYDKKHFEQPGSGTSGYWLRTPDAADSRKVYCVTYDGKIISTDIENHRIGVRPAYVVAQ